MSETLAQSLARAALDLKAEDVMILDVRGRTSYADYLVLGTGTSDRHVQAVAENCEAELKRGGHTIIGSEGVREGQWALIDAGSVIVHIFHPYTRDLYDLETLWEDAPRIRVDASVADAAAL